MLPDGTYETFVVWAEPVESGETRIELTITTGPRKGEVVTVRSSTGDPVDLVGTPCLLVVEDGQPRLES